MAKLSERGRLGKWNSRTILSPEFVDGLNLKIQCEKCFFKAQKVRNSIKIPSTVNICLIRISSSP